MEALLEFLGASLGSGKASGMHIPRTGDGVRHLQLLGCRSQVNQQSHLLQDLPQHLLLLKMGLMTSAISYITVAVFAMVGNTYSIGNTYRKCSIQYSGKGKQNSLWKSALQTVYVLSSLKEGLSLEKLPPFSQMMSSWSTLHGRLFSKEQVRCLETPDGSQFGQTPRWVLLGHFFPVNQSNQGKSLDLVDKLSFL